jgi:hypothetical protein
VAPAFSGFVGMEGFDLVPVEFCHGWGEEKGGDYNNFFTIKETPGYIKNRNFIKSSF